MGSVKLEEASSIELNIGNTPCHPDARFIATMPLSYKSSPLNIAFKDDTSFNVPILHSISQRHPWINHFTSECCYNSWIISMDEEEPITTGGVIDTLNYLRKTVQMK